MDRVGLRRQPAPADQVNFSATEAVDKALSATPDVRAEEVERARQLIGDPSYPPPETIRKLSELLAVQFSRQ